MILRTVESRLRQTAGRARSAATSLPLSVLIAAVVSGCVGGSGSRRVSTIRHLTVWLVDAPTTILSEPLKRVADASVSRNCQQLSYQEPKTYDAEYTDMKITQVTFSCRNFQASAYRRFPVELVTTTSHPGHVLGQCDARFVSQSSCEQAVAGLITAAEAAMQQAGAVAAATPAHATTAASAAATTNGPNAGDAASPGTESAPPGAVSANVVAPAESYPPPAATATATADPALSVDERNARASECVGLVGRGARMIVGQLKALLMKLKPMSAADRATFRQAELARGDRLVSVADGLVSMHSSDARLRVAIKGIALVLRRYGVQVCPTVPQSVIDCQKQATTATSWIDCANGAFSLQPQSPGTDPQESVHP